MNITEKNKAIDDLELIVDQIGITGLCDLIAEVCSAKADHIESNWQDEILAKEWDGHAAFFINAAISPDHCKIKQQ